MDPNNCFLDIQAGSGGTEAQDWASMLRRMYVRILPSRHGFKVEVLEESEGEVAGSQEHIAQRSAATMPSAICVRNPALHRLVRKSPFDSGNRRHTSFSKRVRSTPRWMTRSKSRSNPQPTSHRHLPCFRAGETGTSTRRIRNDTRHYPFAHQYRGAVPERPFRSTATAQRPWRC